ncbi:hypothetical protein O1611_g509 [Lasiodiplodia mahajangana]|uniref:Uncharacterized protein n=1 Tax=Lasiodiplodia mahajangana TaxID=1108764 RepID=A0ACC2K054_9PEZI|nr:hypothetical protein O1611_g509 [Lasiodiplodia mahajangana]
MLSSLSSVGSNLGSFEAPTEQELYDYPWKYIGYKKFTAYAASDPDFFALRRFDRLHTRSLLTLQDQLCELEERLDQIDNQLSNRDTKLAGANPPKIVNFRLGKDSSSNDVPRDPNNGTIRDDVSERAELVAQVTAKLQQYDEAVLRYSRMRGLYSASKANVNNIKNWLYNNNGAIMEAETRFLHYQNELVSFRAPKSNLRQWFEKRVVSYPKLGVFGVKSHQRSPLSPHAEITTYTFSDKAIEIFGSSMVFAVASAMLIAPLWILLSLRTLEQKLGVITLFIFLCLGFLSLTTLGRPFERLAATAGWQPAARYKESLYCTACLISSHQFFVFLSMAPSAEDIAEYLKEATRQLYAADPNTVTVNSVRQRAEEQNDLEKGFFVMQDWKARSKTLITEFVQTLLTNDPPTSASAPKAEHDTKNGVKRSSSDELSSSPVAKRQKKATPAAASTKAKLKKESSSSALSELSDSDVEPKKESKNATTKKTTERKQESDSELSDLGFSPEDESKPTKKRGRKPKRLDDSDDEQKVADAKPSKPTSKRKRPAAKAERPAKRTKLESETENEPDGNKAKNDEVDGDVKMDAGASAKAEDPEEGPKPEKKETKHPADDSDSSLSSVLDEPPPKKRKGRVAKGAANPKQSTSKEVTGDEAEIKKLQGQLVKCGVRKIWGIELKKYGADSKAKIRHLRGMLRDVGMDGRFSEAKAREIKERRELMGELEAVNEMNDLWGLEGHNGRASRSKAVRKTMKEDSDLDDDDDDDDNDDKTKPKVDDGDDEDGVKVKTNSRVSKRMADLAFLGSDSESD